MFSICICGCLTDVEWQRAFLLSRLDAQGTVGNCIEVKRLINKVWEQRGGNRHERRTIGRLDDISMCCKSELSALSRSEARAEAESIVFVRTAVHSLSI